MEKFKFFCFFLQQFIFVHQLLFLGGRKSAVTAANQKKITTPSQFHENQCRKMVHTQKWKWFFIMMQRIGIKACRNNHYLLWTKSLQYKFGLHSYIQGVQEECARLREGVPYVKIYRYNPKHICLKLNGYGDNGQRKVLSSLCSTHYTYQLRR
jgi:hypothetical protein